MRRSTELTVLAVILVVAAALRINGITWGLPDARHLHSYHPDENVIIEPVGRMLLSGDLNPHFFTFGSATIHLTWLAAWPLWNLGWLASPASFYLVGRVVVVALGVATVLVTWRIARRVAGPRAWLAAAFIAVAPGPVLHGHYATVDVPATFFVSLALLLALRLDERRSWPHALLAGMAAGCAFGTKYPAGACFAVVVFAAARTRQWPLVAAAGAGLLLGFALATPYAFLANGEFMAFMRGLRDMHAGAGNDQEHIFAATGNGAWYHVTVNMPYATCWAFTALAAGSLVLLLKRRTPADLLVLALIVVMFLTLLLSNQRFLRYVLPLVPALAAAVAALVGALPPRVRTPATVVTAAWMLLLALIQDHVMAHPDPRDVAADRLAGVSAPIALVHEPDFWTPPLTLHNAGVRSRPLFVAEQAAGTGRHRLVDYGGWDLERLRREQPPFVVLSEFEWREDVRRDKAPARAFLAELERAWDVESLPGIPPSWRPLFGVRFAPHDWLYPFAEVRIYRRRG